jgi:molybdopterin/thiamine biosynthesis adenylyltransferase|tara:strand:+ start:160 stop:864 length:705 start_codon:yes stop_codon:yes gene_type:complete
MKISERHKRQFDIIKPDEMNTPIHIIGCGGIGSWSALLIAKMGCEDITLYDFDKVEDHNIASQFFKEGQEEEPKTSALSNNILEQTGVKCKIADDRVDPNIIIDLEEEWKEMIIAKEKEIDDAIIVIAVDSMEERIKLENFWVDKNNFIIDGRMGGLQLEIYAIDSLLYADTLVKPENVDPEPCTGRSISFNCAVIGGLIANCVRLSLVDKLKPLELKFHFDALELLKKVYESH